MSININSFTITVGSDYVINRNVETDKIPFVVLNDIVYDSQANINKNLIVSMYRYLEEINDPIIKSPRII
jgi:hypothetical protein